MAIFLCLAVGAAILERLSRPTGHTLPERVQQETEARNRLIPANASPSASRLTLPELLDEARRLAARLEAIPANAEALNLAGSIYETIQDTNKAVDCWERTLKLRPGSPEVYFNLGYVAWQMGEFGKAKSHFLKSYDLNPGLGGLRYHLADSLLKLGEANRAIETLEGSSDLSSSQYGAKARCVLGHAYAQSRAFEKARESFEAAMVFDAESLEAHYGMVRVMMRLNEPEAARKYRDTVAQIQRAQRQPELADRPSELTQIASDAGYLRERLAVFYRCSAAIYSHLGHDAEARRLLLRTAALGPENHEFSRSPELLRR